MCKPQIITFSENFCNCQNNSHTVSTLKKDADVIIRALVSALMSIDVFYIKSYRDKRLLKTRHACLFLNLVKRRNEAKRK
ncbi:hypothetical protein BCV72DRAFT_229007 [Rhizopus microsporus var. microsporus]|uniref:Uncharacterized protein n=1 Tax=Rhizopus microsporus var. microsporus TaxID=86635 RepID=A0A1X0R1N6_RHIZD|nr:hypothetical protein BCV72DRAFT_229007 [Rhizopus microsporus var. microsporus]